MSRHADLTCPQPHSAAKVGGGSRTTISGVHARALAYVGVGETRTAGRQILL
jgi:hypothetical protein